MKILAINTAFSNANVCIKTDDKIFCETLNANAKSSESVMPKIDEMLNKTNLKISEIDSVSVVVGPGSFTGVRIGVALVKGFLSVFEKMKAIAINSLDLMAYEYVLAHKPTENFYCIQNALSGRFFLAEFNKNGQKIVEDLLVSELPNGIIVGLDSEKLSEATQQISLIPENLIKFTEFLMKSNLYVDKNHLTPVYIRLSQAEENLFNKELQIEKLKKNDLSQIEIISNEQFDANGWQINLFEEELKQDLHYSFVGKINGEVKSFLFFMETFGENGKDYNILNIATKKGDEHKGYGTKMLNFLKNFAKENNSNSLWLEVRESNTNAIEFYKFCGFKTDYIRKKYYANGENAIVMSCKIEE